MDAKIIFWSITFFHSLFDKKISKSDIADVKETTAEDVRTGCYLVFVSPFSFFIRFKTWYEEDPKPKDKSFLHIFYPMPSSSFAHVCVPSCSVHLMVCGLTLQGRVTKGSDEINYLIFIIHKAVFMPKYIL